MGFFKRLFGGDDGGSIRDHERERQIRASRPPLERAAPAFPWPLESCRGNDAQQRLARMRDVGMREGFIPILLGDAEAVANLAELPTHNDGTLEEYLLEADKIDVRQWHAKTESEARSFDEECEGPPAGEWPANPDRNDVILAATDLRGKYKPQVYIARMPVRRSWETFAHLKYGNWNDCPDAHVHVAIARSWNDRFGAEVVAITGDTVEFAVSRPPRDREQAIALAWEHYWYCSDIVDQGVETMSRLAASLMVSKYWFFWWD